ncbi:GPI ethanolamine phosphate transferas-like protein 2 [Zopfia rhizophila CBS 207.26]|uniref:GPI ethanolamine phosphate transferase 2 n=1 Tax=Zopfia rhizophila CBS 207.26 TaxID=1314779 RepID=A0A6A6E1Y1_9PEZI|nr:GPI ethanolamine phosphate transferas-like protein 2 [Zopfia rhizophila CBS 207.26]
MRGRTILLTVANLLIPVAILVFATGFFPYKPFIPGLAEYEEIGNYAYKFGKAPDAPFNKLVFMVVDALRSDFVFGEHSGFRFTQSLIRSGTAIPFTAHATSPTITMPRVKAITTGSIPSFLDVILNFAESDTTSTLATQDTWLAQLKAMEGGKLVMYGDDTWLKLFPDFFERADGTSSFFVSDFTEVDDNVTRHVPEELLNSDWNAMIMHYLGLDHIGHKAGPNSPNMLPKQIEMDGIVQQIYEAIENEEHLSRTLFVLAGDHGMNDGGNHGGSAPGETSPALVFMSPKLKQITEGTDGYRCPTTPKADFDYYTKIEQSDIAPTLAGLLGFPVPRNNLGVFIPEFLHFWADGSDRIQLLLRNAKQILTIVKATFPAHNFKDKVQEMNCEGSLSSGEELSCKWQNVVQALETAAALHPKMRMDIIYSFCRTAQDIMSSTTSNYNVSRLILGTALAFLSFTLTMLSIRSKLSSISSTGIFYTLILLLYGILMFASSYVEEEQHFWYWSASAWFAYLFIAESRKEWFSKWVFHPAVMLLIVTRTLRRWNQTGQKHAGAPDIAHSTFLLHPLVLWSLVGAVYLDITIRLSRHIARSVMDPKKSREEKGYAELESGEGDRFVGMLAVFPLGATAFVFKLGFTAKDAPELVKGVNGGLFYWVGDLGLVGVARMVFVGLALSASWLVISEWRRTKMVKKGKESGGDLAVALFDLLSLFLITQTRAQNIPVYLLFRMQIFFLTLLNLTPTQITITTLLLTQTSFFALGNSNAISSIDLSNSYNGISGYNISAVGLLVFMSNWAGPVYWAIVGVLLLSGHPSSTPLYRDRYFDEQEIKEEVKDWVKEEREHLNEMLEKEVQRGREKGKKGDWEEHVALLTLWMGAGLGAVMCACTVLRTHLFIWTVFSPKFLFAMAWGVAYHLGVSVGLGGGIWWVGGW